MNTNPIIYLILVFFVGVALNRNSAGIERPTNSSSSRMEISYADSFEAGKIIDRVFCKSDPTQSYALYIPAKVNKSTLPVIYFFDPHADGILPVKKYKPLADQFGFILIGSNNSKNGNDWPTTENICQHLFDDSQARVKINRKRIYTCGFSGGAKVAGYMALKYPEVKGMIANGAGLPDGTPAGDFNFSFTGIAGEGDMNLTDLETFNSDLDPTRTRHHFILFDGKHEWAFENSMSVAFAGLQLDAMQKALIPKDEILIRHYIESSKAKIQSYSNVKELLKVDQECKLSISYLDGLNNDAGRWFKEKMASLANNALYQKQLQEQKNILVQEQNLKAEYMQHFQMIDMHYWIQIVKDLQNKSSKISAERGMYRRLLAYLSLAFYSLSNRMISSDANVEARHYVELYKIADPSNSEAWYFSAILHAREKNEPAVEKDLVKATELGFTDETRMMQQPEFQNFFSQAVLSGIKSRIHAAKNH